MPRITMPGRLGLFLVLAGGLSACSWLDKTFPDKTQEYKHAEPAKPLDVPPDLTATQTSDSLVVPSGGATLSGYTSARESADRQSGTTVLPPQDDLKFERDHDHAWLVVQGDPQTVWPKAREFWLENGFFIASENPTLGTLQTDWVENRAAIPKGPIRSLLSRVYENAYSSAYRDRYRMRLERGEKPGTTELYITQQGVEEIVVSGEDQGDTKWGPRPPDPGLESAMLKRMMIYLGIEPKKAEEMAATPQPQPARAELVQQDTGQATLVLHRDFEKAWRDVGIVLDRVGFAVEDRNRLQGLYYVRYSDPLKSRNKGFLSKLAFWSSDDDQKVDHYQIKLSDDGTDTRVVVLNKDGKPEVSATAVRILNVLYDDLK
jgi:outer membrane protein assembly factor BamC